MLGWLTRVLVGGPDREVKRYWPKVAKINALEPEFERLSNEELRAKTQEFRRRYEQGESLDDLLPEAFAAVREANKRTLGQRHFDVQLIGGIVLHEGKIAEMKTGEGKTAVATLAAYLNALPGRGVHVVTVNDYLARRDTEWMGPIYHLLGLRVACIQHDRALIYAPPADGSPRTTPLGSGEFLQEIPRKEAYLADIVYGTNSEFGFDYLRDNMVYDLSARVQRELNYAIIDEVDNILIDEARTPLIISGPAEEPTELYYRFAQVVRQLREGRDYEVDLKMRAVILTEEGVDRVEKLLGVDNIYDERNYRLVHYLDNALKAQVLYQRDRDYVVKNGEVIIVDEFTGRLMYGRRYSEGLHQAIEAKEGVRIQRESKTWATITIQNYFRLYKKLAGMTGTAKTEEEEFQKIYNLDVVVIPTHRPMIRQDFPDQVYKTEKAKFEAVVREIEELHKIGRPVLVGTTSIEKSERLSQLLTQRGIPHQVLNAKYHELEAQIIAQAGRKGAVTIATNMAGRGTDIKLGGTGDPDEPWTEEHERLAQEIMKKYPTITRDMLEGRSLESLEVLLLGGLHIIGTERHEARRIDNQLRGRAGRQGDPGSSRFYLSLEDDLMRRFGSDRIAGLMDKLGLEDDQPIEAGVLTSAIENAQIKVEGYNFDIRKHTLQYDDVMNKQREVVYGQRLRILQEPDLKPIILDMVADVLESMIQNHLASDEREEWDLEGLYREVKHMLGLPDGAPGRTLADLEPLSKDEIRDTLLTWAEEVYEERIRGVPPELVHQVERWVLLQVIDNLWTEHLTVIEDLREGIGLRAYGQRDPLVEFKAEAFRLFEELKANIKVEVAHLFYRLRFEQAPPAPPPTTQLVTNKEEEAAASAPVLRRNGQPTQAPAPARPRAQAAPARSAATVGASAPVVMKKVGRNDPCPCGSGKKYKKCHGR